MSIVEAEERCEELNKQILVIREEYDLSGWARYCGGRKIEPLREELNKLQLAIIKAKAKEIIL